ncbi:MAG: hypothetical protein KatS3mg111_2566 [Pirellulaceae bacterium]|nr:MAG: hypothetical protein KatS3mg111_2566 [Pirellulaceae bacterium]
MLRVATNRRGAPAGPLSIPQECPKGNLEAPGGISSSPVGDTEAQQPCASSLPLNSATRPPAGWKATLVVLSTRCVVVGRQQRQTSSGLATRQQWQPRHVASEPFGESHFSWSLALDAEHWFASEGNIPMGAMGPQTCCTTKQKASNHRQVNGLQLWVRLLITLASLGSSAGPDNTPYGYLSSSMQNIPPLLTWQERSKNESPADGTICGVSVVGSSEVGRS